MLFFKKFWDVIKKDLFAAIQWFWENGEILKGCNASFITLIPKKADPMSFGDYRPISLISSYYKIIAKLLSNRLRQVIPGLVGSEQSAFLKGRYLLDGALIANETLEFISSTKKKGLIFKVDFEKAFDCLNWDFLMEVMHCMGFGLKWRMWILSCLKSASISILVNGSPTREFHLGRGVRQGNHLSPFLFILATEGLNILTKAALDRGLYQGVKVGNDNVVISHLQYADDTIFFGEWNNLNALGLINILKCFELTSDLKVNFQKSCLYGAGVNNSELHVMARRMGCLAEKLPFIYLGLPIGTKMNKLNSWNPIIEKFKKRLSDWNKGSLSFGGRLTLVKSVLNSLPLYYFSLYRAPPCEKISWVKWEDVIKPYGAGGLSIVSLKSKNLALLEKWWWRFKTETNALWVKVIRSIHGPLGNLLSEYGSSHPSTIGVWNNIIRAGKHIQDLQVPFLTSFEKTIGDGSSTSFWYDNWIGNNSLRVMFPRLFRLENNPNISVNERLSGAANATANAANEGVIGAVVLEWIREPRGRTRDELHELLHLIGNISLNHSEPDGWRWSLSSSGKFTVKNLSSLTDEHLLNINNQGIDATIWNSLVPKKSRAICMACSEKKIARSNRVRKKSHAQAVWNRIFKWWSRGNFNYFSISELLSDSPSGAPSIWLAVIWISAYFIWKNRNNMVFHGKSWNAPVALNEIQVITFDWISRRAKNYKQPISAAKLFNWLKSRFIAIKSISAWGLFGVIVQCTDEASFKQMKRGPTLYELEFLEVVPMVKRINKYTRFAKIAISEAEHLKTSFQNEFSGHDLSPEQLPEEGEMSEIVGKSKIQSLKKTNVTVEIHNSLEKVSKAVWSQKNKKHGSLSVADDIKKNLFQSFDKDESKEKRTLKDSYFQQLT
ncbi:uncharacterized protein [Rutidosis leptorrhynchoides]|uniref:uncharacterized protein n=1 Tax=Rutidosis leptorrhynchoides TaxID=125765 RepID=UPI003A99DB1B